MVLVCSVCVWCVYMCTCMWCVYAGPVRAIARPGGTSTTQFSMIVMKFSRLPRGLGSFEHFQTFRIQFGTISYLEVRGG